MDRHSTQAGLLAAITIVVLTGCEIDSFFNPAVTGRYEFTPTTIPIVERIDVIEREEEPWSQATGVTPQDLLPSDLTYRISPGDFLSVEIFELLVPGQTSLTQRRVDAAGHFRLPVLGDVRAAGLTAPELQDELERIVEEQVMRNPLIHVVVEEPGGFNYTIFGAVGGTGIYSLRRPDLRILDAIVQAGGVPLTTQKIYVIRQVPLTDDVTFQPARERPRRGAPPREQPVDIEELIRQLEEGQEDGVHPGMLAQESGPVIDIDELEPARAPQPPVVDIDELAPPSAPPPADDDVDTVTAQPVVEPTQPRGGESYIYIEERGEWVPIRTEPEQRPPFPDEPEPAVPEKLFVERIIEIPYHRLKQGDSSYNIVIRPLDKIYVREQLFGVVYIDGSILRPGVYSLPATGRLTLSRLVAAAGGPGPLAFPNRVDLTRIVGENREANLRLNLGAIRQRTQPDVYLKPDDHIIMGTSWFATPLAIFRNGFRMTYGFGFLLDRNFGNDVFGAPPTNRQF